MLKKILFWLLIVIVVLVAAGTLIGWYLSVPTSSAETERMQSASHYNDGKFSNPEPQSGWEINRQSLKDALLGTGAQVTPIGAIPVDDVDSGFLDSEPAAGLRYMWLGHSSVLIEIDGIRIAIDPVLSERASPFPFLGPKRFHPPPIALNDFRGVDAALISHNHYDHMDRATLVQLAANGSKIFVPLGMQPQLIEWDIDPAQVQSFDWNEEAEIKGVRLIATPARHYSNRGTFDYKETSWNSWSMVGPTHRVFYSGDTGASKLFAEVGEQHGPFDLGIIKIGAYGPGQAWIDIHLEPEDAVQAALATKSKVLLPVHWATFNLAYHAWTEPAERVLVSAVEAGVELRMPRLGQWVDNAEPMELETWWRVVDP